MRSATLLLHDLDNFLTLTPERYIGRNLSNRDASGIPLSEIVELCKDSVSPKSCATGSYLVADTGDADEGILKLNKPPVDVLGSTKRRFLSGDVVISRLRPYLRQVALVDEVLFSSGLDVVGSTEFYVLRSVTNEPVSFLVPWLLSPRVQEILAKSVEGAHHPRFQHETLMELRLPDQLVEHRRQVSKIIESAASDYRHSRRNIAAAMRMVADAENDQAGVA